MTVISRKFGLRILRLHDIFDVIDFVQLNSWCTMSEIQEVDIQVNLVPVALEVSVGRNSSRRSSEARL